MKCLAEVALQQALERLAVAGLVLILFSENTLYCIYLYLRYTIQRFLQILSHAFPTKNLDVGKAWEKRGKAYALYKSTLIYLKM